MPALEDVVELLDGWYPPATAESWDAVGLVYGEPRARVDKVMEDFGWPMGPAYLEDVVGMDTGSHVSDVIAAGYPDRMPPLQRDALKLMVENGRYGQKNGIGFYDYAKK